MRHLWESVRIALDAIWSRKLRATLTLVANVVAVTTVIGVVSILMGMDGYVRQRVLALSGRDRRRRARGR